MSLMIVMPIIIPLLSAVIMLFFWKNVKLQKIVNVAASLFSLAAAVILIWEVADSSIVVLHVYLRQ